MMDNESLEINYIFYVFVAVGLFISFYIMKTGKNVYKCYLSPHSDDHSDDVNQIRRP